MMEDERSLATEKLTDTMESFAQGVVDPDNTAFNAYKLAYSTKNMQAATIHNEASKLMKLGAIFGQEQSTIPAMGVANE